MGCHVTSSRMRELQLCGCVRCREEFYRLERNIYGRRDYYKEVADHYYNPPLLAMDYGKGDFIMPDNVSRFAPSAATTPAKPEIKNEAVKVLVNNLTTATNTRDAAQRNVTMYKAEVAKHGVTVAAEDKKIAELTRALKKLGHKLEA